MRRVILNNREAVRPYGGSECVSVKVVIRPEERLHFAFPNLKLLGTTLIVFLCFGIDPRIPAALRMV